MEIKAIQFYEQMLKKGVDITKNNLNKKAKIDNKIVKGISDTITIDTNSSYQQCIIDFSRVGGYSKGFAKGPC